MPISHAELLDLFHPVGEIKLAPPGSARSRHMREGSLIADINQNVDQAGLYLWVVQSETEPPRILYLGKTGLTLAERHKNHRRGFTGSPRGRFHATNINRVLAAGNQIEIWAYHPPLVKLGEFAEVDVVSSIEDYLLKHLHPRPDGNF